MRQNLFCYSNSDSALNAKNLEDEKAYDVKYVSLYGIKEPAEISDALLVQVIEEKLHTGAKLSSKSAKVVTSLLGKAINLGYRAIGGKEEEIKEVFSKLAHFDNNVIIFDDLERCSCDVNTVM